jgi:hypothetical protein
VFASLYAIVIDECVAGAGPLKIPSSPAFVPAANYLHYLSIKHITVAHYL